MAIPASITIGQTPLPEPQDYESPEYDIDGEGTKRDELGFIHRDRVRSNVGKPGYKWRALTDAEAATIRNAIKPVQFSVTFLVPGGTETKTMYAGDRMYRRVLHAGNEIRWDVEVAFIEV